MASLPARPALFALLCAALLAPAPARAHERPFARVARRGQAPLDVPALGSLEPGRQRAFELTVESARRVKAVVGARPRVRRAVYPMSNADVKTPLTLFAPDHLVMADLAPFGSPEQVAAMAASAQMRDEYVRTYDRDYIDLVDFQNTTGVVGPAILWELERLGARDVRVTHLGGTVERDRQRIALARWGWEREPKARDAGIYDAASRDVVRVTYALGGRRRSILFTQQDMLAPHDLNPAFAAGLSRGFDAWLEKAPMAVTRAPSYLTLRADALRHLGPGGIVLSDHELELPGLVTGRVTGGAMGYGSLYAGVAAGDRLAARLEQKQ